MGAGDDSARFKDLGHRMMCTCGCGQVLLECNHVGCQSSDKMRDQLLAALDKGGGNNDDLILQGFVQEYGPTVIAAPTATGFNRVAWIMPFLVLALGIAFAVHIVRSWKNRPEPALADGIVIPHGSELDEFRRKAAKRPTYDDQCGSCGKCGADTPVREKPRSMKCLAPGRPPDDRFSSAPSSPWPASTTFSSSPAKSTPEKKRRASAISASARKRSTKTCAT
jgi:cytochrome c-type biogenesis protein CcmH/NrfF